MKNVGRNAIIVLALILGCYVLWYFSSIVGYVLISWVLSMLGMPLKHRLQEITLGHFKVSSALAAGITLFAYFLLVFAIVWLFVPLVLIQARTLAEVDFSAIGAGLEEPIAEMNETLIRMGLLNPKKISPLEQLQYDFLDQVGGFLSGILGSVLSLTTSFVIGLFSIAFITFFFLKDEGLFRKVLSVTIPTEEEANLHRALDNIRMLLTRYFAAILLQITIITIFVSVFLSLLGVPNALLIAFFAALINVIPYLGPIIGFAFGVLMTLASGVDLEFYTGLLPLLSRLAIVFALMQMLDNFILQPFIFSKSVQAHPLEIFIIVMVGAEIYGVIGMVLAIPAYTVFRVVAATFLNHYKLIKELTKNIST